MARTARKPKSDDGGVIVTKDFDRAKKYYFEDIKPARSKASDFMQEISTAFKAVKKICGIQPGAMKAAVKLIDMEEAKRDDWLRSFNGVLRNHNIDPDPKDMVDAMQGDDGYARPKPSLVAVPLSDGLETDLADADGGDDFTEASEDELAAQEGRGGGTGES